MARRGATPSGRGRGSRAGTRRSRHRGRRATATASSAGRYRHAQPQGRRRIRHAGSIPACQLTTCCEIQSKPPAIFATQCPSREDGDESGRHHHTHQRHHERIGRDVRRGRRGGSRPPSAGPGRPARSRNGGDFVDEEQDARGDTTSAAARTEACGGGSGSRPAAAFRCGTGRRGVRRWRSRPVSCRSRRARGRAGPKWHG